MIEYHVSPRRAPYQKDKLQLKGGTNDHTEMVDIFENVPKLWGALGLESKHDPDILVIRGILASRVIRAILASQAVRAIRAIRDG